MSLSCLQSSLKSSKKKKRTSLKSNKASKKGGEVRNDVIVVLILTADWFKLLEVRLRALRVTSVHGVGAHALTFLLVLRSKMAAGSPSW